PSLESSDAVAAPMPDAPPVISATFPVKRFDLSCWNGAGADMGLGSRNEQQDDCAENRTERRDDQRIRVATIARQQRDHHRAGAARTDESAVRETVEATEAVESEVLRNHVGHDVQLRADRQA